MSADRLPFTQRQRRRMCQQYGHRPRNNWDKGDLPAPWCEGDIVRLTGDMPSRLTNQEGPYFVVTYATSIDEGDAWYFRLHDHTDGRSDRLHVASAARSSFPDDLDWMAPFELIDTPDPDGLAERERLLRAGWSYTPPPTCPSCGQLLPPTFEETR